ncbi:hypothetical protein BHE74_00026217 [Ensete ventricosum]|nr:hypothetical protein GW17_00036875 [Ensete ventricosum]RWW66416.1 hypothetical protein BHE74_00026217 [Ensete ventricosum]
MGRGRLVDRLRRLFTRHSRRVVSFSSLTKERDPIVEEAEELFVASRYHVQEVIGKGSYGVVGAAIDTHTGEKVAIKKINEVFEHVSDATRILREIKLLRLLRHPDIVEIKHIMLPPSRREFKDIYVVFELMEFSMKGFSPCFLVEIELSLSIRNEKARRYLSNMRKKPPIPFSQKFPGVDPLALRLLERLLAFDPKDRPTAEEIGFMDCFYIKQILEYHPQMLQEYLRGGDQASFMYPRLVIINLKFYESHMLNISNDHYDAQSNFVVP